MNQNFQEKRVIVNSTYDLAATIAIPENKEKKMPAVIIISGTGTADRDGNMPRFQMGIYKELSDFFVHQGFVTIRYDKRGVGESKGEHIRTGFHDLIDDIMANAQYLEGLDFVDKDRIILCGHSEGCILATMASTRHRFGGLILIAGAGKVLRSALEYQNYLVLQEVKAMKGIKGWLLRRLINDQNYLKNVNKLFEKCSKTHEEVIRVMGKKMPAKWVREHNSYQDQDVLDALKKAACPILAVTGSKDAQANPEDIQLLNELKIQHMTCSTIEDMDHILREYIGELSVLTINKQYKKELLQPIHKGLLKEIKQWLIKSGLNPVKNNEWISRD